jgi:hypothetical protein
MDVSSQLLQQLLVEGDGFLFNIMIGDESWMHHLKSEMKQQSVEWHHMTAQKKKARTVPTAGKVTGTVLWDAYWLIFYQKGKPSVWLTAFIHSKYCDMDFVSST